MISLVFFVRRTLFAYVTVFLYEKPQMQMVVHHGLTMMAITLVAYDSQSQDSRGLRIIEIGNEVELHLISIIISQFGIPNKSTEELEVASLACLVFLFAPNIVYFIILVVLGFKKKLRLRRIRANNLKRYYN